MKNLFNFLHDMYLLTIALPLIYALMGLIRLLTFWDMKHDEGISQASIEAEYKEFFS